MFRTPGPIIGGILMVLVLGAAPVSAQTTLRYRFKEGEKLLYSLEQKSVLKMNLAGTDQEISMTQGIDVSWHVVSVDRTGKAEVKKRLERIRFKMSGPASMAYDSNDDKAADTPIGQTFSTLVGCEIRMSVSPRGVVSDIKLSNRFQESLKKIKESGQGNSFSEDSFKNLFNQTRLILPEKAVKNGDTWVDSTNLKMPFGELASKYDLTYQGPTKRDERAVEQVDLKISTGVEPNPNPNLPFKLTVQGDDSRGSAYFNNAAGRLVAITADQNMTMQIETGGQTVNMVVRQTTLSKLVEKGK